MELDDKDPFRRMISVHVQKTKRRKPDIDTDLDGEKKALQESVFALIEQHHSADQLYRECIGLHKNNTNDNKVKEKSTTFDTRNADSFGFENFTNNKNDNKVEESSNTGSIHSLSVSECISQMEHQSRITGESLSSIILKFWVDQVKIILANYKSSRPKLLLSQQHRGDMKKLLCFFEKFQEQIIMNRFQFIEQLNEEYMLPLEVIWLFHTRGLLSVDAFITANLGRKHALASFTQGLADLCFTPQTDSHADVRHHVLSDITTFLVRRAFVEKKDKEKEDAASRGLRKAASAILDSLVTRIVERSELEGGTGPEVNIFQLVQQQHSGGGDGLLSRQSLLGFCCHQLAVIMGRNLEFKVSQAIAEQSSWSFSKAPQFLVSTFRQLLLPLDTSSVTDILKKILERQEVNWKMLLTFVSTFLVCFEEAPSLLNDMVNKLLGQAFSSSEFESLITAFLLARQACLEGPHIFPPYQHWFTKCFGDPSTSPANTKKAFSFLVKFLTDLVPYEPVPYLRIHISSSPCMMAKFKEIWSDYTLLARTRLSDFKIHIPQSALHHQEGHDSNSAIISERKKKEQQVAEEVDQAVNYLEKTGKIPMSVMEASIFQKPHYLGWFLPLLLKPRMLLDVADSKMKFIQALNQANKIPSSMLQKYELACANEMNSLLEGAFSEDAMEDLEPLEQLKLSLDKLAQVILAGVTKPDRKDSDVASHISDISKKVEMVLGTQWTQDGETAPALAPAEDSCVWLDLAHPQLEPTHLQVVDVVLNGVCRACAAIRQASGAPAVRINWPLQLVAMLSSQHALHPALFVRLWKLVVTEGCSLKECSHIYGLAMITVGLISTQPLFTKVVLQNADIQLFQGQNVSFSDALVSSIPLSTADWMSFGLRFFMAVVQQKIFDTGHNLASCLSDGDEKSSKAARLCLQKFIYLALRLCPAVREQHELEEKSLLNLKGAKHCGGQAHQVDGITQQEVLELYTSKQFQALILQDKCIFSFEEWLQMEILVQPHRDAISGVERHCYHRWMVHSWFIPATIPAVGDYLGLCYTTLCNSLARLLLGSMLKSSQQSSIGQHGDPTASSYSDFISLLQQLLILNNAPNQETKPWLLRLFYSWAEELKIVPKNKDCHIPSLEEALAVDTFMRFCYCLPEHFLVTDNRPPLANHMLVDAAADFVNAYLRNHKTSQVGILEYEVTAYILRALLSCESSTRQDTVIEFFEHSSLYYTSFVAHWHRLQRPLSMLLGGGESPPLRPEFAKVEGLHGGWSRPTIASSSLPQAPENVPIVKAFLLLFQLKLQPDLSLTTVLQFLEEDDPQSQQTPESYRSQLICYLMELALAQMAGGMLAAADPEATPAWWPRLGHRLLALAPDRCLPLFLAGTDSSPCQPAHTMLYPDIYCSLFPCLFFRLMLTAPSQLLSQLCDDHSRDLFLTTLLRAQSCCARFYATKGCQLDRLPQINWDQWRLKPLTLEFMQKCSSFVESCVDQMPRQFLMRQSIDRTLLAEVNPQLLISIQRKISSTHP